MAGPTDARRWPGVDEFVEAYESARERGGSAEVADFAPPAEHPDRLAILGELVRVDLEYRWEQGSPVRLEHYRDLFPALFDDPGLLPGMAYEEYRLRLRAGERPTPADYRRRFGLEGGDWPSSPADPPPAPAVGEGDDLERATGAYRAYRFRGSSRPEELSRLLDAHSVSREYRNLLCDLERVDPRSAERLIESAAGLPEVGGQFLGFRICRELGRGAFGRVYLARQGDLADRLVALKVSADVAGESHALAQLQHTNVVPIYSVHRRGSLQAVCMPYLGSTTLADTLTSLKRQATLPRSGRDLLSTINVRKGESPSSRPTSSGSAAAGSDRDPGECDENAPTPGVSQHAPPPHVERLRGLGYVQAVLWLLARVTQGLAHAHERGILHRDLKPANILFADVGEPLLLDFNLSADTKLHFRVSAAIVGGTLPYMAPESLLAFRDGGTATDPRSDLYSLGVILHEMLTGGQPFPLRRGSSDGVLSEMIADRLGPLPDVRKVNPLVSPAAASIVRHCLEPDPALRYQTARQLQDDLRCQLEDLRLRHAPDPSPRERVGKWARRHPRLSSSTALGLAAAVLMIALVDGYTHRQRRFGPVEAAHALRLLADDHETAYALLLDPAVDPARWAEGAAACGKALDRFNVLDSDSWQRSSVVANLTAPGRAELRGRVGELLMLRARIRARRALGIAPEARAEMVQTALRDNTLAGSCFGPGEAPRAYWVQRASFAGLAGEPVVAARAEAEAGNTPIRSAREFALLSLEDAENVPPRDALQALTEASRRDPQDFSLWMYLGQCRARQGRLAEAEDCFTAAVVLRPRSPWPFFQRGRVGVERGDFGPARLDLEQALRLRPDLAAAYVNRALARMGGGDHDGAVADLTTALDRGATETRVYFIRAEARARAGDRAGASLDRVEGLRRTPADAESWVARGLARLPGNPAGALDDFERAADLDPRSRSALRNRAAVLSDHLGRTDEAVAALDRVVRLYPDDAAARVGRGVLLARLGHREAAHRDAEEASRRDPSGGTSYRVGCIFALTSRSDPADRPRALRVLATALGQSPSWVETARTDPDLDALRDHAGFRGLLQAFAGSLPPAG